ncbi:MAG: hypothetical protein V3V14_11025 [Saprospiraceae bacterium]
MKKSFLFSVLLMVVSLSSTVAQSCCKPQDSNCKPIICCPTVPECCDAVENISNLNFEEKKDLDV